MKIFKQSIHNVLRICFFLFGVPLLLGTLNDIVRYFAHSDDVLPRFGLLAVFAVLLAPFLIPFGMYKIFQAVKDGSFRNASVYALLMLPILWEFVTFIANIYRHI